MEYFDFEEAAEGLIEEDCLRDFLAYNADPAILDNIEDPDIFFQDFFKDGTDPAAPPPAPSFTDNLPNSGTSGNGLGPMYRPERACDYCRGRGLECFIAAHGMMQKGCTSCIALFRNCSLIQQDGVQLDGFPGVFEEPSLNGGAPPLNMKAKQSFQAPSLDEGESIARKSGTRFSKQAVKVLKDWFAEHSDLPYPSERQKYELKKQTGLKRTQISDWLANARRRGRVRPIRAASPAVGRSAAVDIPYGASQIEHQYIRDMSPLERWKQSPPEHEPASVSAIANAVATTRYNPEESSRSESRARSRQNSSDQSSFSVFRAPSMSSLNTGHSSNSDMSFASAFSHRSQGSFGSMEKRGRRRRTIRQVNSNRKPNEARGARIYQCTFCTDAFPAKYDWQRHEKSLHLALEKWTCAPFGGVAKTPQGGTVCVFCNTANPKPGHLETHNYSTCQEKTLSERTFYRKDHLRQHLRLVHECRFDDMMEKWKSATDDIKSSCGFCPKLFATWQCRVDHLAAHFKAGADMSHWTGDWGFQPHVDRLVENAMPPYMIAQDRASMYPFSADAMTPGSSILAATSDPQDLHIRDANCYRRLERLLTRYVKDLLEAGIIPSDKMLQDQGRRIIFDDDDPWNQTSADNAQWLDIFKRENGLLSETRDSNPIRMQDLNLHPPYVVPGGLKKAVGAVRRQEGSAAEAKLFYPFPVPSAGDDSGAVVQGDSSVGILQLGFGNIDCLNPDGELCSLYE